MSQTYRLTYQLTGQTYTQVLYLTTSDPQLGYLLEHLDPQGGDKGVLEVGIEPVPSIRERDSTTATHRE